MNPRWQFVCYLVAILLWVVAPMIEVRGRRLDQVRAIALGLAVFALPALWNAAVAGW